MNLPYRLAVPLSPEAWREVRTRTVFDSCKWDIQSEDHCVLADFPLLIEEKDWQRICAFAEALSAEAATAERELLQRPELHDRLGLPRAVRKQLRGPDGLPAEVARVMRFDFHFTKDGWRISEVNADVPGGFIEASGFTRAMAAHYSDCFQPTSPAQAYADAILRECRPNAIVAMVHATAYSDDRQVVQYLAKEIAARGATTVMASPAHITWRDGDATVSAAFASSRLDVVVRFYPAEWLPMLRNSVQWAPYFHHCRTPISNPATALLIQSKRFPIVWEHLTTSLPTWRSVLPETRCPSTLSEAELHDWVIKPALGRVGEDVVIAGVSTRTEVERVHKAARRLPLDWIAQRRFEVLPIAHNGLEYYPCIGIFTVSGHAVGAYGRIATTPLINHNARDVAVLISPSGGRA